MKRICIFSDFYWTLVIIKLFGNLIFDETTFMNVHGFTECEVQRMRNYLLGQCLYPTPGFY